MKTANYFALPFFIMAGIATGEAADITGYTTSGVNDTPSANIIADATGQEGTDTGYAIGLQDSVGLENGLGAGLTIEAIGNKKFATNNYRYVGGGSTGVYISGTDSDRLENVGSIAATIKSKALTGRAVGLYFNQTNQAQGANISSKITAEASDTGIIYGLVSSDSIIGEFSGSININSANNLSHGMYITGVDSKMGDISGRISVSSESEATGITLTPGSLGTVEIGNIGTDSIIIVKSTIRNATGIAMAFTLNEEGRKIVMGDFAGKMVVESGSTAGVSNGIGWKSGAGKATMGNILSTADISVTGASYSAGIYLDENGKMGTVAGKISAVSTSQDASKWAAAINLTANSGETRDVYLLDNADISARFDANYMRAYAIIVNYGTLSLHGTLDGRQTIKGNIAASQGIVINTGNYVLGAFADQMVIQAGSAYSISINDGAVLDFTKSAEFKAATVNMDGKIILHASSVDNYGSISIINDAAELYISDTAEMNIILGNSFTASAGDVMHVVSLNETGFVTGTFEGYDLFYAAGYSVDKELYEILYDYDGRGGVSILFKGDMVIPEPSQIALSAAALALVATLSFRRRK